MPGYLLDTNHVSAWEQRDPVFWSRLQAEPQENILWVCPITLGEIECGLRIADPLDHEKQRACRHFVNNEVLNFVHPIGETTRHSYAQVMVCILAKYPRGRGTMQAHLTDLKVDVNDVWIVAVALEHNLILLTNDEMKVIRETVLDVRFDNWLA